MTRILVLMTTQTYRAKPFLQAARRLSLAVTVGTEARSALAKLTPGTTIALDFDHPERAVEQIVEFDRVFPLTAVLGIDEATTVLAAQANAALGRLANSVDSVRATRNKFIMRELLARTELPGPAYRLVSIDDSPGELARTVAYPCVVKPVGLSASRGVIRANDPAQFRLAFRRAAAIVRRDAATERDPEIAGHLLIEEYLPGAEVALEGILQNGCLRTLAIFDKPDPLEGPFFEETIYVTPSRQPAAVQAAIRESTARAAQALGLTTGPVHAELRINERGVFPIEVAARSIGGLCSNTLRFGTGLTLEDLILRQLAGDDLADSDRESASVGVMMIPIPAAGILRRLDGRAEAAAVPGIEEVTLTLPVGQRVVPLPEGSQYLGFIFARGADPATVEAALREAHRHLKFTIQPDRES